MSSSPLSAGAAGAVSVPAAAAGAVRCAAAVRPTTADRGCPGGFAPARPSRPAPPENTP